MTPALTRTKGESMTASKSIPSHFATLKVFTTGQAARVCRFAPRTVSKLFDAGRIKGYRIPGSQDRRIPRADLVAFLTENGMADAMAAISGACNRIAIGVECAVPAGLYGWEVRSNVPHNYGVYDAANDAAVRVVLVHASLGRAAARAFAAFVRAKRTECPPLLVLVAAADDLAVVDGFDAVLAEPADPVAFWRLVEAAVPA